MMYQRSHSLVLDENTNPITIADKDPIKPISIHPTKAPIKKSIKDDNSSVRTALSTIMARVKNLRKRPGDEKRVELKRQTSDYITTSTHYNTVNNQENRDPQQQEQSLNTSTTSSTAIIEQEQQPPSISKSLSTSSLPTSTLSTTSSVSEESKPTTPQKKTTDELTSPGIDKADSEDPQSCIEYVKDIHSHYKKIENKYRADPAYLSRQPFMRHKHRFTIVNWMIEVHQKFRLSTPTMYLAVDLLDRFLSKNDINLNHLQLLGATCIFVASKYEDLQYPLSSELVKISMNLFTKEDVLKMERLLLRDLDFNITVATVYPFLKRYLKCARCDFNQLALAYYLSELSLLEEASLYYPPSQIASACIYVAGRLCNKKDSWDSVLQYYTGYSEQDIEACASVIVKIAKKYNTNEIKTCTRSKYSQEEKAKVAWIVMSYFNNRSKKD
ncbi:cyclin B1-like protein [Naegleria gruberi]|uniref:Cyclin B1-like protein n=1 Tax=Naegleria gruberi TaxID=5762 RepID=D2VQU6_NAEGR|nr:cyclin B1-like protein [Naegleria gruberi]EFC40700.1 cyclin B1-like protein [Naegleria gruberi]|eukprot:XP_002673444.1 cyclin B1-like protein [Naegleria gruberi strain NEG-M]